MVIQEQHFIHKMIRLSCVVKHDSLLRSLGCFNYCTHCFAMKTVWKRSIISKMNKNSKWSTARYRSLSKTNKHFNKYYFGTLLLRKLESNQMYPIIDYFVLDNTIWSLKYNFIGLFKKNYDPQSQAHVWEN